VFVSSNTAVAAVDARTGATAWTYDMGNTVSSVDPPAYGNGRVFVATGGHSDSFLYGLDAATGDVAFRTAYGNQWSSWYAPVVSGGTVYKGGGYYGGMYAYSASSGDERWFQTLSQDDEWTPAVDGGRVYAYTSPGQQGELQVHDAATGALQFGIPDPDWGWGQVTIHPTPVLGGRNNVLISQGNRLVSFDLASRTVGWQRTGPFLRAPVVANGRIYAFSNLDVEVRNESDGSLVWVWHSPTNQYGKSMIVTDNLLFVSVRGQTFAIDLSARQQVWSYSRGGHITLTPEGILVIADPDNGLAAIDLR
jgi:outer membrane protein assembly factor BamB